MNRNELTLLYSYMYNNRVRMEEEVRQLQNNIRFRSISVADCVEMICAIQQLETFRDTAEHIRLLLNLGE
ncbi:MAG: hypothetical protein K2N27_08040 [Ruminococcus sp.]|nr:hypothetical protein [Ruminococcus sp.]